MKLDELISQNESLKRINNTLIKENIELNKANKILRHRFLSFLNKQPINNIENFNPNQQNIEEKIEANEDILRDFFNLSAISLKMKYLHCNDIWTMDINQVYIQAKNLAFYEYHDFIKTTVHEINKNFEKEIKAKNNSGCLEKVK